MEVFCTDIQNAGKHPIESTIKTVKNRQIIKFFSTNKHPGSGDQNLMLQC